MAGRGPHLAALWVASVTFAVAQDRSDEARRLNNGAAPLYAEGNLDAAEQHYRAALTMSANDPVQAATIANNLGALYKRLNRYREAEQMYRHALDLRRLALPSVRPEVADSMNNLAEVYRLEGRYWEALNLTKAAVWALEHADPRSPDMPVFLNNLAGLERDFQHLDRAEELARQAWSLAEKSGEPIKLAVAMNTLAQVLADKRQYQEAEVLYRRAGTIFEGQGPDSSYYLAVTMTNLGHMQTLMGQHEEGRETEVRALTLVNGEPLPDQLLRATILHNLGNNAVSEGNFAEAVGYYEQALGWRERILGRGHPGNAWLLFDYAAAAGSVGERSLAHKLRRRAKELLAGQQSGDWSRYTVDASAIAHSR